MIYKQIFIKSVDDLPKEEGEYFCNRSGLMSVQKLMPGLPKKSFQREIRWYLLPCEIDMPSDEELLRQAHKDYPYSDVEWNTTTMKRQIWMECAKWLKEEIIKRNK